SKMSHSPLTDLPTELLRHVIAQLPHAQAVASLSAVNHGLHWYIEEDGWRIFVQNRFPSLWPPSATSYRDVARTCTTWSKAWDRRSLVARCIQPEGDIWSLPAAEVLRMWKRPRGQTIGFTPQLDVYESVGETWVQREEVLAYSAGAEVCVRRKKGRDAKWLAYRPLKAIEGHEDVTSLHLVRPREGESGQTIVVGTANGDLRIVCLPTESCAEVKTRYCATQGQPVRSGSLLQQDDVNLVAANLGDRRISLFQIDDGGPKICPSSSIDIEPTASRQRIWSTHFLSSKHVAAGVGLSDAPILIYNLTPSGLEREPARKFQLQNTQEEAARCGPEARSSIYPIVPLPSGNGTFLSGAHDGIVRLHDLRSNRNVERTFVDSTDVSAVYSLLAQGHERILAGGSRHCLLKVFDLRMGAKAYSYCETPPKSQDWNLFLQMPVRSRSRTRRNRESPVYSLASAAAYNPHIYAGVEDTVIDVAFTD
ncbi:hypothetical protein K470DRAFT_193366, partial [Piedraia hortae CBS 480.64]